MTKGPQNFPFMSLVNHLHKQFVTILQSGLRVLGFNFYWWLSKSLECKWRSSCNNLETQCGTKCLQIWNVVIRVFLVISADVWFFIHLCRRKKLNYAVSQKMEQNLSCFALWGKVWWANSWIQVFWCQLELSVRMLIWTQQGTSRFWEFGTWALGTGLGTRHYLRSLHQ